MTEDVQIQIAELVAVHKGLGNVTERESETVLSGALPFEASTDGLETITDSFDIEVTIPNDFSDTLPRVRETGGRIGTDYDHRNPGGTLCLAVPVEQRRVFFDEPTLLGFVNRLVIPYLYGFCFFTKHGHHPFDEAAHGFEGISRHYVDTLHLQGDLAALRVICFLFEHSYRGHHDCPCGSGRKVRACHGSALLALHNTHNEQSLRTDFMAIFETCFAKFENGQLSFSTPLRRQLLRLLKKFQD
ncbi:MAG: hypothetical protein GKR94_13265 [Gammaproteobacteria bacterium]|nr:hypothetical protein [Gammaproteobacteria bacterium]